MTKPQVILGTVSPLFSTTIMVTPTHTKGFVPRRS